jgi:indolepyruvate ferredoxin oxidoreductase beta subunit
MSEKTALADGRADDARLLQACRAAAKRAIAFDMEAIADASGSVISAVLFGALAGSAALPFPRGAFEAAIRRGNVGVAKSLAAFTAGFEAARDDGKRPAPGAATRPTAIPARLQSLVQSLSNDLSASARVVVEAGVARLAEYQDLEYARQFIERLRPIHAFEAARGRHGPLFEEAARQLALAMSYEDTIRVAALKIARQRFARVREEVKLGDGQILEIAEFLHPRTEEIADTLPAVIGRWLLRTRWARRLVDRFTRSGRTVKTTSLWGFLLLYSVAALRPLRRRSLRFVEEQRAIDAWLDTTMRTARTDYDLAVEVARARNLVKGYGDTHAGGRAKFELLIGCLPRLTGRSDAAAAFARLHKAALADEHGGALKKAVLEL